MDLIYTDIHRNDVGVLRDFTFDLAFGADENDFELIVDIGNHVCEANCLVYIEGTEYGGIIDRISVVTKDEKLTYGGRSWHGILASKVIQPKGGEAYYTVKDEEANVAIGTLVDTLGLGDLFTASIEDSGLTITDYQFDRYVDAYLGIRKMLAQFGGKLRFVFTNGKVVLSAVPIVDYSQDEQFDNDNAEMTIEKSYNAVNHLICLGTGELQGRLVVDLYRGRDGNLAEKQVYFGIEEVVGVYDYPNAKSEEELRKSGEEKMLEMPNGNKIQLDFETEQNIYGIGDIVGARDIVTDTFCTAKIIKKIVTIDQGVVNIQYKVGE